MKVCESIYLEMIIKYIVIFGAINWGMIGIVNINLVNYLSILFKTNINYIVYIIIAACGIYLLMKRDTYLPFLGEAAFPIPLENKIPVKKGDQISLELTDLPPYKKVIYWASNPSSNTYDNPVDAYGNYENQGVVTSDKHGKATIIFNKPGAYKVNTHKKLSVHVHYRYWTKYGLTSEIKTVNI
jgi:uncharacterized membrane protein YuzA (DUF378 family)